MNKTMIFALFARAVCAFFIVLVHFCNNDVKIPNFGHMTLKFYFSLPFMLV